MLAGLAPLAAQQQPPQESDTRQASRVVQDASRALQSGNPALFLRLFDRERFSGYATLESHVVALMRQSEIASSIEIIELEVGEDGCDARVDWVLQLTLQDTAAPLETRHEVIKLRLARVGKARWRITELEPVDFFQPQGAAIVR
jgi:hypothetical protein